MPHPKQKSTECKGEASAAEEGQEDNDPESDNGGCNAPGSARVVKKTGAQKAARKTAPRRKRAAKEVADDSDTGQLETDLIKGAETAVLDYIAKRLEEKCGTKRVIVGILAPKYPWLTSRMVTSHLAKRRRKKDEAEKESQVTRKRRRTTKSESGKKSAETPTRKRRRPRQANVSDLSSTKKGSAGTNEAESTVASPSTEKLSSEKEEGETKEVREDDAGGESTNPSEESKNPPQGEESEPTKEHSEASELTKEHSEASEPTKENSEAEGETKPKPRRRKPGNQRKAGGRPEGYGVRHRPRGYRILTPEQKYDKDKHKQARDYAALEYHKIRHSTGSKRLKRGVLDSILADAKKRYGLPDSFNLARSTILGRVKSGVLIATGTRSPMERVEEELVRISNERLKKMDRQLFAHEGADLANSLIKKYGMQEEIRDFKIKHSYVPFEEDGETPIEEKACYMGESYWKQFLKRNGHRLEVRKLGRLGPQTPMIKVEDQLVEMVNALQRPVRPTEGVRLALSLVLGTPLETELRDFKVRTLKNKSAENKKGELLGPGYWRAFIRRKKELLLYLDGKREEAEVGDTNADVPAEAVEASNLTNVEATNMTNAEASNIANVEASNMTEDNATTAATEAGPDTATHIETAQNVEVYGNNAYVGHTAPPAGGLATNEAYTTPHASLVAASLNTGNSTYDRSSVSAASMNADSTAYGQSSVTGGSMGVGTDSTNFGRPTVAAASMSVGSNIYGRPAVSAASFNAESNLYGRPSVTSASFNADSTAYGRPAVAAAPLNADNTAYGRPSVAAASMNEESNTYGRSSLAGGPINGAVAQTNEDSTSYGRSQQWYTQMQRTYMM